MIGEGKYDALCTQVRNKTRARGAMIIVVDGNKGSGFSCQLTVEVMKTLPGILRQMADQIEQDKKAAKI